MTGQTTVINHGTAWHRSGPEQAPAVVLIHGLGLNRSIWAAHESVLARQYQVISYDLFGHGESAKPPLQPSLALFSSQLLELLDSQGIERCALIGFSLGGMINRRFALDHAHRVSALAILNSPHERSPEAQKLVEQRAADTSAGGPGANLDATIERWFTPDFRRTHPKVIQQVREWVLANDDISYAQCRQVLATGVIELIRPEPPINKPTLVITAEHDSGSTPVMTHAIAAEIKDAETLIVPGLQHMGLVERPELFTQPLMEFLNKISI
jgi:pimeloyl-ACP methyl ester carboxylesterase